MEDFTPKFRQIPEWRKNQIKQGRDQAGIRQKAASLEAQFNIWMLHYLDIDDLTEKYNRQFNSYVPFEYEG
ncbi:MAG: hypothetical protein V8Q91_07995 [Bilophila wadsworthia]|uniref:hypothetical protein n=1 Tax=Bilophila wadsworthia TaxID=35833 RepID=UPI00300E7470